MDGKIYAPHWLGLDSTLWTHTRFFIRDLLPLEPFPDLPSDDYGRGRQGEQVLRQDLTIA